MSKFSDQVLLFFKGLAMGAADVVPGVSGGTIAFVTGIYVELVDTIKSLNLHALRLLKTDGLTTFWQYVNGNFIVILLLGILTSLFSLANVMKFLLIEYPLPLWSFFSGLIIGSVVFLLRKSPPRETSEILLFLVGIALAYGISVSPPVALEGTLVMMFFAGSIALCAMILPGISGSFILVLLGLYPVFIDAIAELQIDILVAFALGGLLGLMLFSRLLSWLLTNFQSTVLATMCGFLAGSLNVIWPWKSIVSSMVTSSGKTLVLASQNLSPDSYAQLTGQDPLTSLCLLLFCLGALLVLGLELLGKTTASPVS
jgi:putative membrane protein